MNFMYLPPQIMVTSHPQRTTQVHKTTKVNQMMTQQRLHELGWTQVTDYIIQIQQERASYWLYRTFFKDLYSKNSSGEPVEWQAVVVIYSKK